MNNRQSWKISQDSDVRDFVFLKETFENYATLFFEIFLNHPLPLLIHTKFVWRPGPHPLVHFVISECSQSNLTWKTALFEQNKWRRWRGRRWTVWEYRPIQIVCYTKKHWHQGQNSCYRYVASAWCFFNTLCNDVNGQVQDWKSIPYQRLTIPLFLYVILPSFPL